VATIVLPYDFKPDLKSPTPNVERIHVIEQLSFHRRFSFSLIVDENDPARIIQARKSMDVPATRTYAPTPPHAILKEVEDLH